MSEAAVKMSPGVSLKPQKFLYQSLRRSCILSERGIRYEIIPTKRKTEVIYISSQAAHGEICFQIQACKTDRFLFAFESDIFSHATN